MDDGTWISEDTLTIQLAIQPDLCIYNRHIRRYEMVHSNRCNWMITDECTLVCTVQDCQIVRWTYTIEQGT